jgi:hypothetical protein
MGRRYYSSATARLKTDRGHGRYLQLAVVLTVRSFGNDRFVMESIVTIQMLIRALSKLDEDTEVWVEDENGRRARVQNIILDDDSDGDYADGVILSVQ